MISNISWNLCGLMKILQDEGILAIPLYQYFVRSGVWIGFQVFVVMKMQIMPKTFRATVKRLNSNVEICSSNLRLIMICHQERYYYEDFTDQGDPLPR